MRRRRGPPPPPRGRPRGTDARCAPPGPQPRFRRGNGRVMAPRRGQWPDPSGGAMANEFAATTTRRPPSRTGGPRGGESACHVAGIVAQPPPAVLGEVVESCEPGGGVPPLSRSAIGFSPFSRSAGGRGRGRGGPVGRQPDPLRRSSMPPAFVCRSSSLPNTTKGADFSARPPSVIHVRRIARYRIDFSCTTTGRPTISCFTRMCGPSARSHITSDDEPPDACTRYA